MSFTIRKPTVNDIPLLFEMIKMYHDEVNLLNKPFLNTKDNFIKDVFSDSSNVNFYIAEYQGNILGYCVYSFSHEIFFGNSISIGEIYLKKEYRRLGISIFLFSTIIDEAFDKNSSLIKYKVDITDKINIEIKEKLGVKIKKDLLVLDICRADFKKYSDANKQDDFPYEIRLAKSYELPDIFNCVEVLAETVGEKIETDIYKLMSDGFGSKPKFRIMVVLDNNEVISFISFVETYQTIAGKTLSIDQVFVKKEYRDKGIGMALLTKFYSYVYDKGYEKVETIIKKNQVEKFKKFNMMPYENLRMAYYFKEKFKNTDNV